MSIIITILQVAFGMTIIIGLHELGHMLLAKLFGMRVESFTLGFPPKIFKKKIGETEYGIGTIPLGGYVTISGMVDESLDVEGTKQEMKPYEFRNKPAWQRMFVILGGIIMNFLLGITIYIFLFFTNETNYISKDEVNKYGIVTTEIGQKIGFQEGDKILNINGKNFEDFKDIFDPTIFISTGKSTILTVENNEEIREVILKKENFYDFLMTRNEKQIAEYMQCIYPRTPFEIKKIINKNLPVSAGDKIIQINDIKISFFHELRNELLKNKDKIAKITFLHKGEELKQEIQIDKDGKLGIEINSLLQLSVEKNSFFQSVNLGIQKAYNVVKLNVLGIWKIITGKISAKENLSGPIGIIKVFTQSHDFSFFLNIIAMLSLCLGIMNVLPIPALDGGHALLIFIEMITGKKIKEKYLIFIQKVGMALMLSLMLYCFYNDIIHLF